MRSIAIFGNADKERTGTLLSCLLSFLHARGVRVLLSSELRSAYNLIDYALFEASSAVDCVLSIGGDGTFLTTAHAVGSRALPILGINVGHLGYLAEVQAEEAQSALEALLRGDYTLESRSLVQVHCIEEPKRDFPCALNEVAVVKSGMSSMINIEVALNGTPFYTYQADGLLVSTATGSTAYNLSIGGPILFPQVDALLLSAIAPHSLSVRPVAVPSDWSIDLYVHSRAGSFLVSSDGRSQLLQNNVHLHIQKADYQINKIQLQDVSFFHSLKSKLNWGK